MKRPNKVSQADDHLGRFAPRLLAAEHQVVSQTSHMDSETQDHTREEWRELGFFYDRDDDAKEWRLRGSRDGLRRFARLAPFRMSRLSRSDAA